MIDIPLVLAKATGRDSPFEESNPPAGVTIGGNTAGDAPEIMLAHTAKQTIHKGTAPSSLPVITGPPLLGSTPIRPNTLKRLLNESGYDEARTQFLFDGFCQGFRLDCSVSPSPTISHNLQSAQQHPEIVTQKLLKEIQAKIIAGPFSFPPFTNFVCSPLGVCPKKKPGTFRLIHHLSYPEGQSVNAGISEYDASVSYTKLSDAIAQIKKLGSNCFLAKSDIESAFRLLPVHPDDHHLLGMSWDGKYYYNLCLPMGCASSCKLFEEFSTALEHLVRYQTKSVALHVLDDFLFIEQTEQACKKVFQAFIDIAYTLGVPLAADKTEGPTTVLSFLDIELDTVEQVSRLPLEKLNKCRDMIISFLPKKKTKLRALQSLIGLLNFACYVVPGRPFLRRLIDKTGGVTKSYYKINLTKETKKDLRVWLKFLEDYNGKTFFMDEILLSSESLHLFTDAAQEFGFGAVFGQKWFYGNWPLAWKEYNIVILELFPIVLALEVWGKYLENRTVCIHCDNLALVHIINKQTAKEPLTMILIHRMVLYCLSHNIIFISKHIPGKYNSLADSLSRLQVSRFHRLAQHMELTPTAYLPLPASLI